MLHTPYPHHRLHPQFRRSAGQTESNPWRNPRISPKRGEDSYGSLRFISAATSSTFAAFRTTRLLPRPRTDADFSLGSAHTIQQGRGAVPSDQPLRLETVKASLRFAESAELEQK
jgi:hypothetical protein